MNNLKRLVVLALSIVMCVTFAAVQVSAANAGFGSVTYGDADENDKVEANDLVVLKKVLLDAADENKSCDANNDKDVNILDFILLKKYLAGEDVKLGGSSGNISGDIEWN